MANEELNAFPTQSILLISIVRDALDRAAENDDIEKVKEKIADALKPLEQLNEMASKLSAQVGQSLGQ